jgi:hypothetical protein
MRHIELNSSRELYIIFIWLCFFIYKRYKNSLSQDGNSLHIKVAEVIPKFTFLGKNLDEALNLQKQHEDLLLNIQVEESFDDLWTLRKEMLKQKQI